MRQSKEERIIKHSETVLHKLEKVSDTGSITQEYRKLLNEFKKLNRRFDKTMKQGDKMGSSIMEKNESLNDNLHHTIKTAREKLMGNIVENRKIKESSNKNILKLKMLEKSYNDLYEQNTKPCGANKLYKYFFVGRIKIHQELCE